MGNSGAKFRFLVTGGAGFIGSNICEELLAKGHFVVCLDNLSTGNIKNIIQFKKNKNFKFIKGDIQNFKTCLKITKNIDFVINEAAWGSVPRSFEMPLFYCDNNIKGTLNMLEASRLNHVKRFVYASSSSVYGDEPKLPKKEGVEGNLLSPYALTKRCDEEWAKIYSKYYGLSTVGLRYFNVFGKRQNPNGAYAAVIPKFIKKILNGERPIINGDGLQSRDFTYVKNVVDANINACFAETDVSGKVFNIACGGQEILIDVYNTICKLLNAHIEPIFADDRKGDIKHSNADISLAKKLLKYEPKFTFVDGLRDSIEWYKENL